MPSKHSIKLYVPGGYYHVYNRGVEKRVIFKDEQDSGVFLSYLKTYLLPKNVVALQKILGNPGSSYKDKDVALKLLRMNNFSEEITLLAYCLMPNHFHLFLKQSSAGGIDRLMNSLGTRYSMHFNRKYRRVGPLYQGPYKAILVGTEPYYLYLTNYIHKQSLSLQGDALQGFRPSSYPEYLGLRHTAWVHPEEILSYFSTTNSRLTYKAFVESSDDFSSISQIIIEE